MGRLHGPHGLGRSDDSESNTARETRSRLVRSVLAAGADVNLQCNESSGSALANAMDRGYGLAADLLLAHGASATAQGRFGLPMLHAAGGADLVEILLRYGAPVDVTDHDGDTRLAEAASDGDLATASALLSRGADVNARNRMGMTPLMQAAATGGDSMVWFLLRNGARIDDRNSEGRSALEIAEDVERRFGTQRSVEILRAANTASPEDIPAPSIPKSSCDRHETNEAKEAGEVRIVHPSGVEMDRLAFCIVNSSDPVSGGDLLMVTNGGRSRDSVLIGVNKLARQLVDSKRECSDEEGQYRVRLCQRDGKASSVELRVPATSGYETQPQLLRIEWPA